MSDVKKYPSTIPRCKGVVVEPSNFYSGKAVVLNTHYGELVLFSSEEDCISAASALIMPNHFKLDISRAQSVSIFSSNRVDTSATASNQDLMAKLQADNELLREHMIKIHEISGDIQVHHFASRALAATAKGCEGEE